MEEKDKLIAALKAENETLKKVKDFACINLNNYIADNNKLKAENEKLKEELSKWLFAIISDVEWDGEIRCNNETPLQHLKKCQNALRVLPEIKEIALLGTNTYKEEKEPDSLSTWKNAQFEKIIDLITKAEEE